MNLDRSVSAPTATGSMGAEPPSADAASKAVPRTVITFTVSDDRTVAIALPA